MNFFIRIFLQFAFIAIAITTYAAEAGKVEYLTELQERFLYVRQDWGQTGINTCAYLPDVEPLPLQIGEIKYDRGIGHHANGEILVELKGEFDKFEATVGVQSLPGSTGSVVFKVIVDGKEKFNSGIMKHGTEPKQVSVALDGAYELELVVTDAGDGIAYDCANWIDTRLVRGDGKQTGMPVPFINIASFGEIVQSDPARIDGARAGRTQEYYADDIYLEIPVAKDENGNHPLFISNNGEQCIGINWIERRHISELSLAFAEGTALQNADGVKVQYWNGGTPYQGRWTTLSGTVDIREDKWVFNINRAKSPDFLKGTWKVRWILPSYEKPVQVTQLIATSYSRYYPMTFHVEINHARKYSMRIYNGEIIEDSITENSKLQLRCTRTRPWQTESTTLFFDFENGGFGISMDDVLAHDAVYVKEYGVFVARADANLTLAEYRKNNTVKKTILEEVREMPDQTFEQALDKVHNPVQNYLPTMLSLSCENRKFIVERNGTIWFSGEYEKSDDYVSNGQPYPCRLIPKFGSGKNDKLARYLESGWLPAPVTQVQENGILYRQSTFVAPSFIAGKPEDAGRESNPICTVRFTITNENSESAGVSLSITIFADVQSNKPLDISRDGNFFMIKKGTDSEPVAFADAKKTGTLTAVIDSGEIKLQGSLNSGETAEFVVYIPAWRFDTAVQFDPDDLYKKMEAHWHGIMSRATTIELPDPLLMNVIRASQVHCLIASRNEADGARIAPWIASVAYGPLESESNSIIRGMDMLGHNDFARHSLDFFIHRYAPSGLLTTGYTLMGMGWHLHTVGEHYALYQDREWLRRHSSDVARACEWVLRQRDKTKNTPDGIDTPQRGLMPPGVMADWNAYAYYFCLNGYFCAGLRETSQALMDIEYPDAEKFFSESEEFKKDILRAYHHTQSRMPVLSLRDGTSVPAYPSALDRPGPTNSFFPGEDGNRSWCYDVELGGHHLVPQGILDPDSKDVEWMMNHMEDFQFLESGWFDYPRERNHIDWYNLGGFSKVQPYYTRAGEIYAMRDDVKPFIRAYFNSLSSLLNRENLSIQEHFSGFAAWNKTHETGYFLQQTRFMLLMEHSDELYIAPLITSNWLKDGNFVGISNAPTRFGRVSYRITSAIAKGYIDAWIEPIEREQPKQIVLRLRHPEGMKMKNVIVNGIIHKDFEPDNEIIRLKPSQERLNIRAQY